MAAFTLPAALRCCSRSEALQHDLFKSVNAFRVTCERMGIAWYRQRTIIEAPLLPLFPLIGVRGRWVLTSSKTDAKDVASFLGRREVKIMGRAVHSGLDKIHHVLLTTL